MSSARQSTKATSFLYLSPSGSREMIRGHTFARGTAYFLLGRERSKTPDLRDARGDGIQRVESQSLIASTANGLVLMSKQDGRSAPRFTMSFEPMSIEHLGLRLYSTLPPVISELVSNAYDADSPKVEIQLPTGAIDDRSEVVVRDFGHGMDDTEVQLEYLPIGRNRRGPKSDKVKSKGGTRLVTGRKGLGKLSGLGIARQIQLRSIQAGQATCIVIDYDEMEDWATKNPGRDYEPNFVSGKSGATPDPDGVEIRLKHLHRKSPISHEDVRRGLARRLTFIGKGFEVVVNGISVGPGDRLKKNECASGLSWNVSDIVVDNPNGLTLSGWFGFVEQSSQINRGIDIYANGKAVELGSFFNLQSTHAQFARAHIVGELHADFLDAEEDLASTARTSVVWESEMGRQLEAWGQTALSWAFKKWIQVRQEKKRRSVIAVAGFQDWLDTRQPREQRVAERMLKLLIEDPNIEVDSAASLLEIVKSSVETVAFQDLVHALETDGPTSATLLQLFDEWRIIEAREHLKLADGRAEVLKKLYGYIEKGALEVKEIQPLFRDNVWLLDPGWTEVEVEERYTKLLEERFPDDESGVESDRRLDLFGVRASGEATIIELKRPEKTLSRKDLGQIEDYVDWARSKLASSSQQSLKYVSGLLVVGELSNDARVQQKMERLAGDHIHVVTFTDLHKRAQAYYEQMDQRLKAIAPEFAKANRKKARKKGAGTQVAMPRPKAKAKKKAGGKKPDKKKGITVKEQP